MMNVRRLAICLLSVVLLASFSLAQQLTGTLSGTVADSAGAVVPNAKVTMKNAASGDVRTTVSNGSGYFAITAVQPGSYTVSIEAQGFKTWSRTEVGFAQGDNHTLSNIKLEVGNVSETVEIKAGADVVIPDNAEVSTTLNADLIQRHPDRRSRCWRIAQGHARHGANQRLDSGLWIQRQSRRHQQRPGRRVLLERHAAVRRDGLHA